MSVEKERRTAGGRRIPIKTIVEIGAGEAGAAAFEAESVNITTSGMHLRTAYLPEVGEPLVCRMEANGKEVLVQGEVAWRNQEACGGEFGVHFSEVDSASLQALRELAGDCPDCETDSPAPPNAPSCPQRGTRVRLHIEGLGSPMKARVRDATTSEVMVGSNLEFLKVGRLLDLENIDASDKRGARIERINVEVDPVSRIPQLVVALRYLDASGTDADEAPSRAQSVLDRDLRVHDAASPQWTGRSEADANDESDEELARKAGRPQPMWNRLREFGPVLSVWGGKAKDVVSQVFNKAQANRTKDDGTHMSTLPRRTTAPPPAGGLKATGKKVVRQENAEEQTTLTPNPLRKLPKRAAIGGAVALVAIVAIVGMTRKSSTPPSAALQPAEAAASNAATSPADLAPFGAPTAVAVAHVPLFGPTPMTTTEPAALPASPPPAATTSLPVDKITASAPGPGTENAAADEDSGDDDSSNVATASAKGDTKGSASGSKSFVHGKVHDPVVLSLRMTNPVRSLRGMPTATGFMVHVAGSQSKDPAAALAQKDHRIAAVRVANKGSGADLTVQFKDGVPAYAVRANGTNLQIAIGRGAEKPSDRKVAKADHHHSHKASKHHAKH